MKTILIAATGVIMSIPACKDVNPPQANALRIEIDSSVSLDFQRFLEAIWLLIGDEKNTVVTVNIAGTSELSFRSIHDFEFDACHIHVLQDRVALGYGNGRQLLTVDELQTTLRLLAKAAEASGSEGFVSMASDKNVSLQFGLKVLNAIDAEGIPFVLLASQNRTNDTIPSPGKKPSPPTSKKIIIRQAEQAEQVGASDGDNP